MTWAVHGAGIAVVLVLAACASPVPPAVTPAPMVARRPSPEASPVVVAAAQPSGPGIPAVVVRALASPSPVTVPLSIVAGRNGADVRVTLDRLLQEQVFLTSLSMDAAANARLDELLGVSAALDQNALVLAEVFGAVKGPAVAEAFLSATRARTADLLLYAQGQVAASVALNRRRATIAEQLASESLSAGTLVDLLEARDQAQLGVADASLSHDPLVASSRLRLAAADSDELGRPLAAALSAEAPRLAAPPTEGPPIDVRLGLNRLLVEHVYLTGAAIEAAADGRPNDLQARIGGATASAAELGAQLAAARAAAPETAIAERLRAQTAALVALAGGGDRSQAVRDVAELRGEIDGLLAAANPLLPAGLLNQQLRPSDQALVAAADAFMARDFATAYARVSEAARQIQKPADTLALSIVDRYPGRYLVQPTAPAR